MMKRRFSKEAFEYGFRRYPKGLLMAGVSGCGKSAIAKSIASEWGMNLIKYQGINLPGGVQFDGQALLSQGNEEMEKIEDTLQDKYELPPDFFTG